MLAAHEASDPVASQAASFDAWADAFAADWMRLQPESATVAQYFDGPEQAALDRMLAPLTAAQRERQRAMARKGLARLAAFDPAALPPRQRTEAALLRWSLQQPLAAAPFDDHAIVFSHLGGPVSGYVNLLS